MGMEHVWRPTALRRGNAAAWLESPDFDEKTALGMQYALSLVGIEASIKQDIYGGFHVLIATDALDAILWMRTDDLQTAMSLIDAAFNRSAMASRRLVESTAACD
ncbi:Uncharacterised protein [Serratia fonticola]|uniref:Uncharacterized protein n=1 Tax=Serratia fonticola TaxID=47917 RepID=A0A4U9UPF0_SERFO|nr:Uncharacterised protein [Serratia fonticola]